MQRTASLSLDLDNKWSYMKTHGDSEWDRYPTYLPDVVPRIVDYLDKRDVKITFFIVGKDATLEENHGALRSLAQAGHEIGNHSFNHDPWLHLYSESELVKELDDSGKAIEAVTGVKPKGFRGPGFSLSRETLNALSTLGYEYDATVFPNLLNPLARAYFFATSDLSDEEKEQRKALFGTWKDALNPVKPFVWDLGDSELHEFPVTTMPVFKVPIHLSYIIYLSKYSKFLSKQYLRFALAMCRLTGTEPSILLHPLDFMGEEDSPDLKFFPGMDLSLEHKMAVNDTLFDLMERHYELVPIDEHLRRVEERRTLPVIVRQN